jgi:tetratricopeptide (TPR) repeat protein
MQSYGILNFDRFDVHTKNSDEFAREIKAVEEKIEMDEKENKENGLSKYKNEYKQLTVYHAFAKRNQILAKKYSEKYKAHVIKDSFDHGEACNLLGNANFMAGGDSDAAPFHEALSIFEKLEKEITDKAQQVLLCINQGFAHRYIGLAAHRKSMNSKNDKQAAENSHEESVKNYSRAKQKFEDAIKIQNETQVSSFPIDLDLMETLHLMGVRQTRQGQYTEAIAMLEDALEMEKSFNQKSGGTHFLTYITMQSLGEARLLIGKKDEALKILEDTLKQQEAHFDKREHIDIAKTLHFIGMAQANKNEFTLATQAFEESLKIKEKLLKPNDFMIQVTNDELKKAQEAQSKFKSREEVSATAFQEFPGTLHSGNKSPRSSGLVVANADQEQKHQEIKFF